MGFRNAGQIFPQLFQNSTFDIKLQPISMSMNVNYSHDLKKDWQKSYKIQTDIKMYYGHRKALFSFEFSLILVLNFTASHRFIFVFITKRS